MKLGKDGIRVNTIACGPFESKMMKETLEKVPRSCRQALIFSLVKKSSLEYLWDELEGGPILQGHVFSCLPKLERMSMEVQPYSTKAYCSYHRSGWWIDIELSVEALVRDCDCISKDLIKSRQMNFLCRCLSTPAHPLSDIGTCLLRGHVAFQKNGHYNSRFNTI